ncbi:MAG: amino acid dehydrogenase [Gemmatimonadetes bacterium]|nr:amino acid dehydrogenase [Gemmatimonadota bacterium]MYD15356.1 amino acid dehydrogenase [Gemmatimonadota bacterium]
MSESLESMIEGWDGLGVVSSYHAGTGSWIFVALHDDTLGRPTGGCRLKQYDSPAAALRDAMRLAEGMTWKWAAMDFPYGGGKSVLAVPGPIRGDARRRLFTRFGEILNGLNGAYGVGEDLGTTPGDMAFLATVTPHVAGAGRGGPPPDPGPFTAAGVHAGILAAVAHVDGEREMRGKAVLVQGTGDVGGPLAHLLAGSGARVLVCDLDEGRARAVADACGGEIIDPAVIYDTPCDVYAPCAVGATVNERTIPRLRCRIVAGAANNQLEVAEDAERVRARGILYAPDYVINGGGAMAFGLMEDGFGDPDELIRRVRGIGGTLAEIFRDADARGASPVVSARALALKTLGRT